MNKKPNIKPVNPNFSSGPCAKHPGFTLEALKDAPLGRSHRSVLGKSKLHEAIIKTKEILNIPEDYLVGIVPASDTGAIEMSMWNLLGARGIDVIHFDSFGKSWATDITKELKLDIANEFAGDYGELPDLSKVNFDNDVVFTWNGTTSGVKIPSGDFISDERKGLTICDATSAVFAMELPWEKLDVVTFSWQKVLGGEAGHGMLIMSPRAVQRIEEYTPEWPMPKIFKLKKDGKFAKEIFEGSTINTPSMLCNEDYLDALRWTESVGGLAGLIERSQANFKVMENFVEGHSWTEFLAKDLEIRSNTSVCLTIDLPSEKRKKMLKLMEEEEAAYDINSYKTAPEGIRVWCGATVEKKDLEIMLQWLDWAYNEVK